MKIRHVRAIAVFGIALVALTGARGYSGGSCGGGSSSGSSGSGSSNHDSTSGGSTGSTGSTTGGSVTGGSKDKPADDVRITSCTWSDSRGITARVSATNSSSSEKYTYKFSVTFTDPNGAVLHTGNPSIPYVMPGSTDTLDTSAPYILKDGESAGGVGCKLSNVTRTVV